MYEYQCKKCKKLHQHYLKVHYSCECGGKFRYLYKPVKSKPTSTIDPNAPLSTEFIPVKCFGGFGDIWYYRRKQRKRLKT